MVNTVESFSEIQEEHTHGTTLTNSIINIMKELSEACASGSALPESSLGLS